MGDSILLYGLGAVGGFYAYILHKSATSTRVSVCARSNYDQVTSGGLRLRSEKFGAKEGVKFQHVVKSPSDPSLLGIKFSFVVCANKAITMTPSASEQIEPVISEDTTIVLIQNGVGNEEQFRERFPRNAILSGVTWVNANQPSAGLIVHKHNETMQFGCHYNTLIPRDVEEGRLSRFVELLRAGGTDVEVVENIELWRWKKTIWNCTWNTLTALTLLPTNHLLASSPSAPIVARRIISEMASIARALGHTIEDDYLTSLIERDSVKQGLSSSMAVDAANSRAMEVEVIVSHPLRKAKELGLETPTLECIAALISALDWRFRTGYGQNTAR